MSDPIQKARADVTAALHAGLAQCALGNHAGGCFSRTSPAGKAFAESYETWMTLRARAGDRFALSLGYTHV